MFKHYLLLAFNNIVRQKGYSFINIFGLAIGIACFVLIAMWVFDELSFDQFHVNKDRIFRVNTLTDDNNIVTASSWRLGPAMKENYPELEDYSRVWPWAQSLVKYEEKNFYEQNIYLADSSFFSIFSYAFIYGNPKTALSDKYSIVITEKTATRYFGTENPIGKIVLARGFDRNFKVAGVIRNLSRNSHLQFDIIARVDLMPEQRMQSWEFTGDTYVLLNKNVSKDKMNIKIAGFYKEHVDSEIESIPVLQQFTKIHLYTDGTTELIKHVYIFSAIAIFVLIIACINFMNLSTARAAKRAKEVGIRKVFGAVRKQLIYQFWGESIIISFIALILVLPIIEIMLPFFNTIAAKNLSLLSLQIIPMLIFLIGIALMTGIVAGSYPALLLSSFQPAKILKGNSTSHGRSMIFRKGLTIFQFTISAGLIICTFIVHSQLDFLQTKNLVSRVV